MNIVRKVTESYEQDKKDETNGQKWEGSACLYLTFSHSPFILAMAFSRANSLLAEEEISWSLSPSL
jgi:hypothetical protein